MRKSVPAKKLRARPRKKHARQKKPRLLPKPNRKKHLLRLKTTLRLWKKSNSALQLRRQKARLPSRSRLPNRRLKKPLFRANRQSRWSPKNVVVPHRQMANPKAARKLTRKMPAWQPANVPKKKPAVRRAPRVTKAVVVASFLSIMQ